MFQVTNVIMKLTLTYRGFINGWVLRKLTSCEGNFATLPHPPGFEHLEERKKKDVQFKKFFQPVKTNCPTAENFNETPEYGKF